MGFGGTHDSGSGGTSRSGGSSSTWAALADVCRRAPLGCGSNRAPLGLTGCGGALCGPGLCLRRTLGSGCSSRRGRLGRRTRRLLGMSVPAPVGRLVVADSVTSDLAPDAVRLGILDAGGMALDAYAHVVAQIYCALVRQPQLFGEFIDSYPLGQLLLLPSQKHFSITGRKPPRTPPPAYWRFGGDCGRESATIILHGLLLSPSSRLAQPSRTMAGATRCPRADTALAIATGSKQDCEDR